MPQKRIVLAEDDFDDRTFFQEYLDDRDDIVLVSAVENGMELFDYLKKVPAPELPDLIILDQNMPKKNGIETLDQLKADTTYLHIPVVVYSTYTDHRLIQECTKKGAALVLSKPSTRTGYQEMMNRLLKTIEKPA